MPELIEAKMLRGSSKAILVEMNGEEVWIAKSQIEAIRGIRIVVPISDWLAWQKGLITKDVYDERIRKRDEERVKGRNEERNDGREQLPVEDTTSEDSNIPF